MAIPRSRLSVRAKLYAGVVVEHLGKVLLVRDSAGHFPGFDFPGGKVLWSEEIKDCAVREFKEETGYEVILDSLLGIYQRKTTEDEDDYVRFIFIGKLKSTTHIKIKDPNIVEHVWLETTKIGKNKIKMKSPETIREINDYLSGQKFPLEIIETYCW